MLRLHWIAVVVAILLVLAGLAMLPVESLVEAVESLAMERPFLTAMMLLLAWLVAGAAFLPTWPLLMIVGYLFGLLSGVAIGIVGVPVAATAGFAVSRGVARSWIVEWIRGRRRLEALDAALAQEAFKVVALMRMVLVMPFNLLNGAFGVSRVSMLTHAAATLVGMLPAIVLYVYLGTLSRDIGQILEGDSTPGPVAVAIAVAAIAIIVLVVWLVHRAASRILEDTMRNDV